MRRIAVVALTLLLSVQSCSDGSRDASAVTAVDGRASLAVAGGSASQASSYKGAWTLNLVIPSSMLTTPFPGPQLGLALECDLLPNGTGTCGRGKDATSLVFLETPQGMNVLVNLTDVLGQDFQFLVRLTSVSPVQLFGTATITGTLGTLSAPAGAVRR